MDKKQNKEQSIKQDKKQNTQPIMKPLKELNLTSRFLFDEVMEDPQAHQDVLSIIFGKEIPFLESNETEKEFRVSSGNPHYTEEQIAREVGCTVQEVADTLKLLEKD